MAESLRAIRLLVATAWRVDRRLTLAMVAEPVGNTLVLLSGLWLAILTTGVLRGDTTLVVTGVTTLVVAAGLGWQLDLSSSQWRMALSEKVAHAFETKIARLTAALPTLEHHERPEFRDKLELLRQRQGLLGDSMSMLAMTFKAMCAGLTVFVLLVVAHPVMLLLAVLALPTVAIAAAEQRWRRRAEDASATPGRIARHLRAMAYDRDAGMEIRVFGLADEIERRANNAWRTHRGPMQRVERRVSLVNLAREIVYITGVVAAVGFMLGRLASGLAVPGDVVLVIYLSQQVQAAVIWPIQAVNGLGQTLRTAERFLWLSDYAARATKNGGRPAPDVLAEGITFDNVSFRYPGSDTWVLRGVSARIPAGSVLAVVGENGVGKTTLVKLMTRMYEPTEGRIFVDGVDLADIDIDIWRRRVSAAFQDFAQFEFTAQHTVGVGDLDRLDDQDGVDAALARAGATDVLAALPEGQRTQLGTRWNGVDLSTGQWQKLALARGMMRPAPLVLFLDEPTASLDALTEHVLFDKFAAAMRRGAQHGKITVLVTHRFSTVSAADVIMVLAGQEVAEYGTHRELLSSDGLYANLYTLQAESYHR